MNDVPFLLGRQAYSRTLSRQSLDFQSRMLEIFGDRLTGAAVDVPQVLVLTRADDRGADAVGLQLATQGVPYLRIDVDALPGKATLTLLEDSELVEVSVGLDGRPPCVPRVVWLRHFDTTAIVPPVDDSVVRSYVRAEWSQAVRSLLSVPSIRWINHPDVMHELDRLSQLRLAWSVGLLAPRTLVSNDPIRIQAFVASCVNGTVVKVLGSHFVETAPGTLHGIFPQIISVADVDDLMTVSSTPSMYQEYVPHVSEVRVTAFGDELVAAEVVQSDAAAVFERPDHVSVQEHSLPLQVEKKLRKFMKLARLEYGAFDLLLSEDGSYSFLEVNPTGDWTWLEARNDNFDITGKLCLHLIRLLDSEG